jgi:hypothetical protein
LTNLFLSNQSKEESEAKAKRKIALTSLRDRLLEDKPPAPTNTNRNV